MDHKIFITTLSFIALIGAIHSSGLTKNPITPLNYEIIENDLIIGNLTNTSVSIFTSSIQVTNSTHEFRWTGSYTIRRIEILNQNPSNGTNSSSGGVVVTGISGGINFNFVAIYLAAGNNQSGINALIRGYGDSTSSNSTNTGNDFIIGNFTNGSTFLASQQIQTLQNSYNTTLVVNGTITRIEARDRNNNGTGGFVSSYSYGLGMDRVQLNFNSNFSAGISFNISVFGVPNNSTNNQTTYNDFVLGYETPNSVRVFSQRVLVFPSGPSIAPTTNVSYSGDGIIRRVEAWDQSGQGAYVSGVIGGLHQNQITLQFSGRAGGGIDFYVIIFAEDQIQYGQLTERSVLLYSENVTVAGQNNQTVNATVRFNTDGRHRISMIDVIDRGVNRTGGMVDSLVGGVGYLNTTITLRSSSVGGGISLLVNVYGDSVRQANDFRHGVLNGNSRLLRLQRVISNGHGNQNATANFSFSSPGFEVLSLVQAVDQVDYAMGGFVLRTSPLGDNMRNVSIDFQSTAPGRDVDFLVEVYGH